MKKLFRIMKTEGKDWVVLHFNEDKPIYFYSSLQKAWDNTLTYLRREKLTDFFIILEE